MLGHKGHVSSTEVYGESWLQVLMKEEVDGTTQEKSGSVGAIGNSSVHANQKQRS
jgi:hypothetical protein